MCVLGALALAQCIALLHAVRPVSPERFASAAHLRVIGGWQIGFLRGQHGAWLVRTPATVSATSATGGPNASLIPEMLEALDSLPRKAALEGILFSLLFLMAFVGFPALVRRPLVANLSPFLQRVISAGLGAVVGMALFSPYLLLGYGASAFSNWVGPGAYSSSGPYLTVTGISGETVSYRTVVEAAALPGLTVTSYLLPRPSFGPEPEWRLVLAELLPSWLPSASTVLWHVCVLAPFALLGLLFSYLPRRKGV